MNGFITLIIGAWMILTTKDREKLKTKINELEARIQDLEQKKP